MHCFRLREIHKDSQHISSRPRLLTNTKDYANITNKEISDPWKNSFPKHSSK